MSPEAGGSITHTVATTVMLQWPAYTDIILGTKGQSNMNLMKQHIIVCTVLQYAIENVHANLVFHNAFPNAGTTVARTRAALVNATIVCFPSVVTIHQHLMSNKQYMENIVASV